MEAAMNRVTKARRLEKCPEPGAAPRRRKR